MRLLELRPPWTDCSSANKGNLIPGMLSAPGMVPAAASSRDRTSKSLAPPEARSDRSSEKETVGTGEEGMKVLRAVGPQDTCGRYDPQPHPMLLSSQTALPRGPASASALHPGRSQVPPAMVPAAALV